MNLFKHLRVKAKQKQKLFDLQIKKEEALLQRIANSNELEYEVYTLSGDNSNIGVQTKDSLILAGFNSSNKSILKLTLRCKGKL